MPLPEGSRLKQSRVSLQPDCRNDQRPAIRGAAEVDAHDRAGIGKIECRVTKTGLLIDDRVVGVAEHEAVNRGVDRVTGRARYFGPEIAVD